MRLFHAIRNIFLILCCICPLASAQNFDSSDVNIGQRSDDDVLDHEVNNQQILYYQEAFKFNILNLPPFNFPGREHYSGFSINPAKPLAVSTFIRYGFNENNSFIGKGITDANSAQIGVNFQTKYGFSIQPNFSYKYASLDNNGTTTFHSDNYGGTLSLVQKVFPLPYIHDQYQPNATWNLRTPSAAELEDIKRADIFPNFDIKTGVDLSLNDSDRTTLTKGAWSQSQQDIYDITPNVTFEFFITQGFAVSIIPNYNLELTSANNGTSASTGVLQIQDRNSYTWVLSHKTETDPAHPTVPYDEPDRTLQLYEFNTLAHDTNQEPLTTGTTPIVYQNWAKFGLGLNYKITSKLSAKAEYSYDAFNALYEAHSVVASINYSF